MTKLIHKLTAALPVPQQEFPNLWPLAEMDLIRELLNIGSDHQRGLYGLALMTVFLEFPGSSRVLGSRFCTRRILKTKASHQVT